MSKWMHTINIAQEWKASNEDGSLVYNTADAIATRLERLNIKGDNELDSIIFEFKVLAQDKNTTYEDFNYIMEELYDWADKSIDGTCTGAKNCWIDK